jgi:L-threonylcarbamoyladenylate synthase
MSGERHAPSDTAAMDAALVTLRRGGVVVYPTETLYGLGVDATNPSALHRLVTLKVRQAGKPISVLVSDAEMLNGIVVEIPKAAGRLMHAFWPGPLTIVLRARAEVSEVLTAGSGTIGVRISSHPQAAELVRRLGRPLTTPSANPAGARPPVSVEAARAYFGDQVDVYVDAGTLPGEPASTVVEMTGELRVVREGAIPESALRGRI